MKAMEQVMKTLENNDNRGEKMKTMQTFNQHIDK